MRDGFFILYGLSLIIYSISGTLIWYSVYFLEELIISGQLDIMPFSAQHDKLPSCSLSEDFTDIFYLCVAVGIYQLFHELWQGSWDRPVYRDDAGMLWKDVNPLVGKKPNLCTSDGNEFGGGAEDGTYSLDMVYISGEDRNVRLAVNVEDAVLIMNSNHLQ